MALLVRCDRLGIDKSIEFISQDIADPTFRLPVADFYYAYCPVIGATGRKVWAELIEASEVNPDLRVLQGGRHQGRSFQETRYRMLVFSAT